MTERIIPPSELVLNKNKSVYHLGLKDIHVAENIIIVGDQSRVELISNFFDTIEYQINNREFKTHTGTYNGKRVTALSTGIGTDNIDIVMNELDAAVNINLESRKTNKNLKKLNIVRIGTSGALQEDIPVGTFLMSSHGLGLDGLMEYYKLTFTEEELKMSKAFITQTNWNPNLATPYFIEGSKDLLKKLLENEVKEGITATAIGFYGPQGRELRAPLKFNDMNNQLSQFHYSSQKITNFEMETSAFYGLGRLLGHNCATICLIIANRNRGEFFDNYFNSMNKLIKMVLNKLTT